jgi:protocatechuate 3,4-dioxygenase beta subunit
MKYICSVILFVLALCLFYPATFGNLLSAATCEPTSSDVMGPFYKPNAPIRARVGKGYLVQGTVRSSIDCGLIPGAVIELWLAGPEGGYDDSHRTTVVTDASGRYSFESNAPPPIEGRPPHIHLRISAKGFNSLVTQHYPAAGTKEAIFDIVLVPSR